MFSDLSVLKRIWKSRFESKLLLKVGKLVQNTSANQTTHTLRPVGRQVWSLQSVHELGSLQGPPCPTMFSRSTVLGEDDIPTTQRCHPYWVRGETYTNGPSEIMVIMNTGAQLGENNYTLMEELSEKENRWDDILNISLEDYLSNWVVNDV